MRFVQIDRDLLQERYEVTELYLKKMPVNPISILRHVQNHDLVFIWFASWHAILPLLFARSLSKPSVLVIGGYDVACVPDIGYGHQCPGVKKWVSRGIMHFATQLVTFSYHSREEAVKSIRLSPEDVAMIYLGVDSTPFPLGERKEPMAVTVGNVSQSNLTRKGLESFVRSAQHLSHVPFILIGRWRDQRTADYLQQIAPSNVTLTGYISDEELVNYLQRAKVYVQPSAHEGFGLSVAEAMLCGCIPVTTEVGALPEVVRDTGVYVSSRDPQSVAEGIKTALALEDDRGQQARAYILKKFPLSKRREGLFDIVEQNI